MTTKEDTVTTPDQKPELKKEKMQMNLKMPDLKVLRGKMMTLVKKELSNYFSTPVAYIVFILFTVVLAVLLFGFGQYAKYGTADLTQMFTYVAFSFIIIIPALTMSSISKEKQTGTIEYILTQPISELDYLISKFISYSLIVILMLLLTLPTTILIATNSSLDLGQAIMQYIGAFILGECFVSIGISVSALFKSEIASFLTSLVVSALFVILGSGIVTFSGPLSPLLDRFSLLSHYQSISRGVLDLRDILYFLAFLLAFLSIAYFLIIKDKFPKKHQFLRYTKIATVVLVVIAIVIGYLGQIIPGRIDFTSDKRYTLSDATTNIIGQAKDVLNITLYASSNLPLDFQSDLRNVQDLLQDYVSASGGRIVVTTKDPTADSTTLNQAQSDGITQISFNVNSENSAQTVLGYFGLTFKYLDKSDVLNLDATTINDLEYQVTSKIKKVADINEKSIAFIGNNVAHTRAADLTQLDASLQDIYTVSDLTLDSTNSTIPAGTSAVVIPGPDAAFDPAVVTALKNYYDQGGSIYLLTNGVSIDQNQQATANANGLLDLFSNYGINVNQDLVYDLKQNNIIAVQSSFQPLVFNYPLWINAQSTKANIPILSGVDSLPMLWGSSININSSQSNGAKLTKLLETTSSANTEVGSALSADFQQTFTTKTDDGVRTVGVALENAKGGRAVIVGDSGFISDNILSALSQRQSEDKLSLAFALNSISWLTKDDAIGTIKSKSRVATALNLNDSQSSLLIGLGTGLPLVIIILGAGVKFYRRRQLMNRKYEEISAS